MIDKLFDFIKYQYDTPLSGRVQVPTILGPTTKDVPWKFNKDALAGITWEPDDKYPRIVK